MAPSSHRRGDRCAREEGGSGERCPRGGRRRAYVWHVARRDRPEGSNRRIEPKDRTEVAAKTTTARRHRLRRHRRPWRRRARLRDRRRYAAQPRRARRGGGRALRGVAASRVVESPMFSSPAQPEVTVALSGSARATNSVSVTDATRHVASLDRSPRGSRAEPPAVPPVWLTGCAPHAPRRPLSNTIHIIYIFHIYIIISIFYMYKLYIRIYTYRRGRAQSHRRSRCARASNRMHVIQCDAM